MVQFSPLMAQPRPFKLVDNGESMIKVVLVARDEPVAYYYYDDSGSELVTMVFDDDDDATRFSVLRLGTRLYSA